MANQIHFENYVQECTESVGNPFGVSSLHTQSNSYTEQLIHNKPNGSVVHGFCVL